jgi:hypothetical protein
LELQPEASTTSTASAAAAFPRFFPAIRCAEPNGRRDVDVHL